MKKTVKLYTDGACRGNPGPGGWGALLEYSTEEKSLKGAKSQTTNNRMELMAAIKGLAAIKQPCRVELTTDSQYVKRGITEWMVNWQKNNWRNSKNKPVKNVDLWQELIEEVDRHDVHWYWVKGHSGHPGNERADELANQAIDALLKRGD